MDYHIKGPVRATHGIVRKPEHKPKSEGVAAPVGSSSSRTDSTSSVLSAQQSHLFSSRGFDAPHARERASSRAPKEADAPRGRERSSSRAPKEADVPRARERASSREPKEVDAPRARERSSSRAPRVVDAPYARERSSSRVPVRDIVRSVRFAFDEPVVSLPAVATFVPLADRAALSIRTAISEASKPEHEKSFSVLSPGGGIGNTRILGNIVVKVSDDLDSAISERYATAVTSQLGNQVPDMDVIRDKELISAYSSTFFPEFTDLEGKALVVMECVPGLDMSKILKDPSLRSAFCRDVPTHFEKIGFMAFSDLLVYNNDRFFKLDSTSQWGGFPMVNMGNILFSVDRTSPDISINSPVAIDCTSGISESRFQSFSVIESVVRDPLEFADRILSGFAWNLPDLDGKKGVEPSSTEPISAASRECVSSFFGVSYDVLREALSIGISRGIEHVRSLTPAALEMLSSHFMDSATVLSPDAALAHRYVMDVVRHAKSLGGGE